MVSVDCNKRLREAVVVRQQGTAPGSSLVQAVRRAGYNARVIPTLQLTIECPNMGCAGCPEKVQATLQRMRGVRGIGFASRTKAVVYYDGRRVTPDELVRAVKRSGFVCSKQS